ncbi:MAG: DUF4956 domain-containing protein [Ilumatobacter sp.]|jgi:hypothetical protein|uniref:DUF4956 domain-containing protein n=2 Tax=Ilumatobacter sp. TaxID=1967498 RepID=UPI001DD6AD61|nr:DUF4956 domain-containing protein [Ilumatobacter sp.]MBT5275511.1 DUF4956 domain-containing protein [Ilumatobacter sp.]MBT5552697.1 DUF4956 domain-containing protein [Ilumatobacter sp.]MBT5864656.1 DUF4956 domain-containing protein [Ilumatobacter sp.]MBT7430946.1 DUF4956 domain-containing protein [Ilumatobacter sp.]
MSTGALVAADLIAVSILAFALYFPRHRRRDMIVAILCINIGVLAVATTLAQSTVSAGLGLGLFGVLSIIRLRSQELDQEEVAYYFSALALGLLGGIQVEPAWVTPVLMAALLAALFVGDHPRLFSRTRTQTVTLGAAYTSEVQLTERLEEMLGCRVRRLKVRQINLVNDTTVVDVRYELVGDGPPPRAQRTG